MTEVITEPATDIEELLAALNGLLQADIGEVASCGFEWGETIAYGHTTPTQVKSDNETFSQIITGLDPGTLYHFRAFAIVTSAWELKFDEPWTPEDFMGLLLFPEDWTTYAPDMALKFN